MRNGKDVTWTCTIKKECATCGERWMCWSDEELDKINAEYKIFLRGKKNELRQE